MSDLDLDLQELRNRARAIRSTADRIRAVEDDARIIAGLVGNETLAKKVNEFGTSWGITRGRIVKQLELIADMLDSIVNAFEAVDCKMARAIRGESAS